MKCSYCNKEVNEFEPMEFNSDFDVFHKKCFLKYKKEKNRFFNEIIHDDVKFKNWINE